MLKKRGKIENMLYSLDSNAVSDILRRRSDVLTRYREEAKKDTAFAICDVVYYEVVRGLIAIGASSKIKEFMKMYEEMEHLPLDIAAFNKAIDIYVNLHKGNQIEDNDIYIAAIAMVNNCTLVTANEKHFGRINGLNYINWRE